MICPLLAYGWCLLNDDKTFVSIGYIRYKKESLFQKLDMFSNFLDEFMKKYSIDGLNVVVEEPCKVFQSSHSSAGVISLLQGFNMTCRYVIYKKMNIEPILIMPSSARKIVGIGNPRGMKSKERKIKILQFVQNLGIIPEDNWKLTKNGTFQPFCFDMSDAVVLALGYIKGG